MIYVVVEKACCLPEHQPSVVTHHVHFVLIEHQFQVNVRERQIHGTLRVRNVLGCREKRVVLDLNHRQMIPLQPQRAGHELNVQRVIGNGTVLALEVHGNADWHGAVVHSRRVQGINVVHRSFSPYPVAMLRVGLKHRVHIRPPAAISLANHRVGSDVQRRKPIFELIPYHVLVGRKRIRSNR